MKISIVIHNRTAATVTRTPSWLGRLLLGRQETTRAAYRVQHTNGARWFDSDTHREVESRIGDAIERELTLRAVRDRQESLVRR